MALILKKLFSAAQTLWNVETLLGKFYEINSNVITHNDLALIRILLFGNNSFNQYDT